MTSYGLDVLYPIFPSLPASLTSYMPSALELSRISYYSLSLGLLTALPAIVSGIAQASKMFKSGGMHEADGKTLKPKGKAVVTHAVTNYIISGASAYSWWCRRKAGGMAYEPQTWMIALSLLLGLLIAFSANVGTTLAYRYGAGMQIGKSKYEKAM